MKLIECIFLIALLITIQNGFSQEIPEGALILDENTIVKDVSGNKVEMFTLLELMNSGDWSMDPVVDDKGKLLYMQLRKATEEEKEMMSTMPTFGNNSNFIGKPAPGFKMKDSKGNLISSENTNGKVVVLNFWFAACKPCIAEIPELNEVYEKYKSNTNVVFASITFEKKGKVEDFLKKHLIKYPVVYDAKEICNIFEISGYPTNIVIDKNGNYYDHISGGFPQIGHQISNSIQNALDGKEPILETPPSDGIMIDPTSVFKLENEEVIPFEKAIELLNSNNYDIVPKKKMVQTSICSKKNSE